MTVLGPESLLVGMGDVALEDDAPGPHLPGIRLFEVQTGERDAHEHNVSVRNAFAPAVPHGVEGDVGAVFLALQPIALNAESVAVKHEGTPLIVEGVEHYFDEIIISERIAREHMGADEGW